MKSASLPFRVRLLVEAALAIVFWFAVSPLHSQTSAGLADVRIRGDVRRILAMPDGSFVLGGFTAYFNGNRDGQLIRVKADGTRVAFPVDANGQVEALALSGPWLYLGGDFQVVNGVSVPFAARVNATTGAVDPTWRPAPNGDLLDIVPVTGGVVLNGSFSRVSGLPRSRLALVSDTGAGRPIESWTCDANSQVDRLVSANGWLYAGGRFSKIGSASFSFLARIAPGTGAVDTSWNPAPNGPVFDIAVDATHTYLAGGFTKVGNSLVSFLARLPNASTNADVSWYPDPDSLCARVCVSGDSVYTSGNFTTISGLAQSYIARIVRTTGSADATWHPPFDGAVLAFISDGASGCWAGGRFDSNGTGAGFAHFTNNQGSTAPSYPATIENRGAVKVIRPNPVTGGWLVGGSFDTVNGTKRHGLFRMTSNRTVDLAWSPGLRGYYTEVNAMEISGSNVLIGGQFEVSGIGNELLYNCLLIDIASGSTVTAFRPQPSGTIYTFWPENGTWLAGGDFVTIGGQAIAYIARVGQDGHAVPVFNPQANGPVHAILQYQSELYLGGEFTTFTTGPSTYPAPYLARLNNLSPDLGWQPQPNQAVFALAADGNHLYVGGRFTNMNRQRRRYLAQIPLGGAGTATPWNPSPDAEVTALRVDGSRIYVGGAFFGIGGYVWPKLARFTLAGPALDTTFMSTGEDGNVFAIEPQLNGDLFVGGSFTGWDDSFSKRSLVAITPGPAPAPPPDPLPKTFADDEVLADYFFPQRQAAPTAGPDRTLTWTENATLPSGMVSRVQWSTDLHSWHESGDSADGITGTVTIDATGTVRTAHLVTAPPVSPVFLRVAVTAGENSPSKTQP